MPHVMSSLEADYLSPVSLNAASERCVSMLCILSAGEKSAYRLLSDKNV